MDTLHFNFPDSKIDLLVNNRVLELVSEYPNINKVHAIEKDTIKAIKHICRENQYDLAVVVHSSFSIAMGLFLSGVKYRLGTSYRWYSFLFNVRHRQHRKESIKHELEYNLDLLGELNCKYIKDLSPKLNVDKDSADSLKSKMSSKGIDLNADYIVIHIPTLGSAKVWSDSNFVKLIDMINSDNLLHVNIILTGTKDDTEQVKQITGKIQNNKCIYCFFDLNLKELSALLSNAKLFIGNSSGPIHISAAVGTYIIGLYSPVKSESPVRWGPYTDNKQVFVPAKDDNSKDVMDEITPLEVFSAVKKYLTK